MTVTENKDSKSVLELSHDEARKYFLKHESYFSLKLPKYFKFKKLLSSVDTALKGKKLSYFYKLKPHKPNTPKPKPPKHNPCESDKVNYKIFHNKDGKYAWRPFQLINPALYVSLVHAITTKENWELIQDRFTVFAANKKIECTSIPRESLTNRNSGKKTQISNWWKRTEQRSIEMALDYPCLTRTDLTDCYGAIYTHSVAWALAPGGKDEAKKSKNIRNAKLIGDKIDNLLKDMSCGQTNGIPQGSTLMDFIAEMVLGYADLKLSEKLSELLEEKGITKYKILRYRDDYRIFSHSQNDNDKIIKCLTEIMIGLGLKLNAGKTSTSSNVIQGAIKSDKLFWIKQKQTGKSLQKHLLIIHDLSMQFPNSGSLKNAFSDFLEELKKRSSKELKKRGKLNKKIIPLISIVTDIAHKSPDIYHHAAEIINSLLKLEDNTDQKKKLLKKIIKRFNDIPNTGYLDIWIQRIAFGIGNASNMPFEGPPFGEHLCKLARRKLEENPFEEHFCELIGGKDYKVWDFSWLESELSEKFNISSIIDKDEIKNLTDKDFDKDETASFDKSYY